MFDNIRYVAGPAFVAGAILLASVSTGALAADAGESRIKAGQSLTFSKKKGNCLACHRIKGGEQAGTVGPPLESMKARYPNRETLKQQLWDARQNNPRTIMPPFGAFGLMSDDEIDRVIDFLYTK